MGGSHLSTSYHHEPSTDPVEEGMSLCHIYSKLISHTIKISQKWKLSPFMHCRSKSLWKIPILVFLLLNPEKAQCNTFLTCPFPKYYNNTPIGSYSGFWVALLHQYQYFRGGTEVQKWWFVYVIQQKWIIVEAYITCVFILQWWLSYRLVKCFSNNTVEGGGPDFIEQLININTYDWEVITSDQNINMPWWSNFQFVCKQENYIPVSFLLWNNHTLRKIVFSPLLPHKVWSH